MEIEEDEEKLWYCLNCVAGLEMDLLRQCRQRCHDMEDVEKFVVPMETTVRSHGVNRMVKDTKVKYQGYVFAKLRLCPETYEAIQGESLCWILRKESVERRGIVNGKR
jgi:transcription antitermination factor NusG